MDIRIRGYLLWVALTAFCISCDGLGRPSSFEDRAAAMRYIQDPDKGLCQEMGAKNGIRVRAFFLPPILLPGYDGDQTGALDSITYLILSLSLNNKELLPQLESGTYGTMVQTLSFGMAPFIHISLDGSDEIELAGLFFQPTYNMASSNDLVVVLDQKSLKKVKDVIEVELREFGLGIGKHVFVFQRKDIDYISSVHIKNLN